ncbi:hypothetical protein SELMODRAFT_429513 [Selaginella moellendorffii]|uniref:Uncharacterized protein n=1 Tax=Selaginella moellendorffii TaxID=88036 RepID=D8T6F2_SELML|nr:hypothetical protein SELMODRAFT_429513 [Selaginella moellendorffii]
MWFLESDRPQESVGLFREMDVDGVAPNRIEKPGKNFARAHRLAAPDAMILYGRCGSCEKSLEIFHQIEEPHDPGRRLEFRSDRDAAPHRGDAEECLGGATEYSRNSVLDTCQRPPRHAGQYGRDLVEGGKWTHETGSGLGIWGKSFSGSARGPGHDVAPASMRRAPVMIPCRRFPNPVLPERIAFQEARLCSGSLRTHRSSINAIQETRSPPQIPGLARNQIFCQTIRQPGVMSAVTFFVNTSDGEWTEYSETPRDTSWALLGVVFVMEATSAGSGLQMDRLEMLAGWKCQGYIRSQLASGVALDEVEVDAVKLSLEVWFTCLTADSFGSDEEAQERLEHSGKSQYFFTTAYFSEEEIARLLEFRVSSGKSVNELLGKLVSDKGELCTSHDVAPLLQKDRVDRTNCTRLQV